MSEKKHKVTGIGGIFFKVSKTEEAKKWYEKHLGIPAEEFGHSFMWRDFTDSKSIGRTVWSISENYFNEDKSNTTNDTHIKENHKQTYMINYRVANLVDLLAELKASGVVIVDEIAEYPYGKFAHILDLDGNKIELWESAIEQ